MANALKLSGYDFHFSFGKGTHNVAQGASEFPESLTWLWRDYNPEKTQQTLLKLLYWGQYSGIQEAGRNGRILSAEFCRGC
jgi:hypothetical protein